VVGTFANCLFQIWHGILLERPSAPPKLCSRMVNEILKGRHARLVERI
jgi:hypothetical protein